MEVGEGGGAGVGVPGRRTVKRKMVGQTRATRRAVWSQPPCFLTAAQRSKVHRGSHPDVKESGFMSRAGSHVFAVFMSSFGIRISHTCNKPSSSVHSCTVVCAVFSFSS